jgi:hypothetical protein
MRYAFTFLLLCFFTVQHSFASVIPSQASDPAFWHDTTAGLPLQPVAATAEKKVGFFGKAKVSLVSLLVKKAIPKHAASKKRILNIVALSLLLVGLAVPLLGGPLAFLWLVPASLVTGIVALVAKDGAGDQTSSVGNSKKRKSNAAAIAAIIISVGLLLFLGVLAIAFGSSGHR